MQLSHADIPADEEQRKSNCAREELGYEADQESEDSDHTSNLQYHSVTCIIDVKPTTTPTNKSTSNLSKSVVVQPWLCKFLLKFLAEKFVKNKNKSSCKQFNCVLNSVFNEILGYQINSCTNNVCLSKEVQLLLNFCSFV